MAASIDDNEADGNIASDTYGELGRVILRYRHVRTGAKHDKTDVLGGGEAEKPLVVI